MWEDNEPMNYKEFIEHKIQREMKGMWTGAIDHEQEEQLRRKKIKADDKSIAKAHLLRHMREMLTEDQICDLIRNGLDIAEVIDPTMRMLKTAVVTSKYAYEDMPPRYRKHNDLKKLHNMTWEL